MHDEPFNDAKSPDTSRKTSLALPPTMNRFIYHLKSLFCALLLCGVAAACSDSDDRFALTLSTGELRFEASGGMQRFKVNTPSEWTLSAPDWVVCSPTGGEGPASVAVTVTENGGGERTATLTVTATGETAALQLTQERADFTIDREVLEFDGEGTPIRVIIESKYAWTIRIPEKASWLTATPSKGAPGQTTVVFTPRPVTDRTPRGRQLVTVDYGVSNLALIVSHMLPNDPPAAPQLLSPAADEGDVAISPLFVWQASDDPDGDPVSYEVQVSPDGGATWPYTAATTETRIKLRQTLDRQSTYLWRVRASDPFGGETLSEQRVFSTGTKGAYADRQVIEWQHETAGASRPVHLVFTGDGYIAEDYIEGGAFDRDVKRAIDAIFGVEPYATYRDYFRISAVTAYSQERGTTVLEDMKHLGPSAQQRNTVFQTRLDGGGTTGVTGNYNRVFSYALEVPGINEAELANTVVFVLINVDAYAGTCQVWSKGRAVAYCPMGTMDNGGQPAFESIIVHEGAGHGFGRLVDEYRYYDELVDDLERQQFALFQAEDPWYGWNVSFTDERNSVHWKHYFTTPGYDAVGLYEGALLFMRGVWRPEQISCMEDNRPYFNAPSREAIVRRICRIAGMDFNFDLFVSKDRIKSDPTGRVANIRGWCAPETFIPLAPPVRMIE